MIEISSLKELIDLIPLILNYIAPGYIFYTVKNFQLGSKAKDSNHIVFESIILSFVINSLLNIFIQKESNLFSALSMIVAILMAIVYINIIEENWFIVIAHKLNLFKTAKKDLISDVVDSKLGMWMYVYINEEEVIYLGKLTQYEDTTEDDHRYMMLSGYSCYSYSGEEISNNDDDCTKCALLNIANITRVEIIYDENSKKIKEMKKESKN